MTSEEFLVFYPQFSAVNSTVLSTYVGDANLRFEDWLQSTQQARRLYIAHKLTLFARSYAPDGSDMSVLTDTGSSAQVLSKSVGGISISRSESSGTSSINGWNEWKQTIYGLQLIGLAKRAIAGGVYVP